MLGEKIVGSRWVLPAVLVLVVFALYAVTIGYSLVWDDPGIVGHVMNAWHTGGLGGVLISDYGYSGEPPSGYWRPVTSLTLLVNGLADSPAFFHATNMALYAACALLLFLAASSLLQSRRAAFFAALLFVLNPLHTESVAFVNARHDIIACAFILGAVLAWDGRRKGGGGILLFLEGAALLLAGLSKESAFMLPAALLAWDLLEPRGKEGAGWWERNRSHLAAWGAAIAAAVFSRFTLTGIGFGTATRGALPGPEVVPVLLVDYLGLLAAPWPIKAYYDADSLGPSLVSVVSALLFLLAVVLAAGRDSRRWGLKAAVWVAVFLLPVLGIVRIAGAVMAARHLFIASAGSALLLGFLLDRWARSPRWKVPALAAGAAAALLLGWGTAAQLPVWEDDLALGRRLVGDAPRHQLGYNHLAKALIDRKQYREAIEMSRRAVKLAPGMAYGYINLGAALAMTDLWREAEEVFRKAVELDPAFFRSRHWLGVSLARQGRSLEAMEQFQEVIRLNPDFVDGYFELALVLELLSRWGEAEKVARAGLVHDPVNPGLQEALHWAVIGQGHFR